MSWVRGLTSLSASCFLRIASLVGEILRLRLSADTFSSSNWSCGAALRISAISTCSCAAASAHHALLNCGVSTQPSHSAVQKQATENATVALPVVRSCETTLEINGGRVTSWTLRGNACD